jgi:hypothetical protein
MSQQSYDVGAVRAFRTGKLVTRERITALEPERRFAYEGAENPRLTDYWAAVELTELPGGGTPDPLARHVLGAIRHALVPEAIPSPLHAGHGDRAGRSRCRRPDPPPELRAEAAPGG